MKHEILSYKGDKNSVDVDAFCKKQSHGCYIYYSTFFGDVLVIKTLRLIISKYAPSDYPNGYYHNGQKFQWSEARKIACQNAGMTRD